MGLGFQFNSQNTVVSKTNLFPANVGFTCKRGWREPGDSQGRDRRDCRLQAFVRWPYSNHGPS
jgi:hypothetical protein